MVTTSARRQAAVFGLAAAFSLAMCFVLMAQTSAPKAIVAGTVFDSQGLSVPGCKLVISSASDPKQKWQGISDRRGEFAIRVPAGQFHIAASAKGFESQEKTVEVDEGTKSITTFMLSPVKKRAK